MRTYLTTRGAACGLLGLTSLLAACTDSEKTLTDVPEVQAAVAVASVTIIPSSATVAVGSSVQFRARNSAGNNVTSSVRWIAQDRTIAQINASGVAVGLSPGTTLIGAKAPDGYLAKATLTVTGTAPAPGPGPSGGTTSLQPRFASYVGGSSDDMARDIATDAQGNVYVGGSTSSRNFPVLGAFDLSFNSSTSSFHDAFLAKVSPNGQLIWSTYIGGPGFDRIYALEVDAMGFIYVAGRAGPGFPVTAGAFQTTFAGGDGGSTYGLQDGFVCKFRNDGRRVWCSYFGDSDALAIRDIAVDGQGDVYVGTATARGTFPAGWFVNGFQKRPRGGDDLVIAKISSDGSRVLWATYLGGSANEITTPTVRVDAAQNVVVFTATKSRDIPTPGGFDRALNGASDGYVAKIAANGSRLIWATYLGGSGRELNETHSMTLHPTSGDVIVAAGTTSTDFPTTTGALQRRFNGLGGSGTGQGTNYPGDAFVTRISASGTGIVASTLLGGSAGDGAEGVWVDASGGIYVSGTTYSNDFPVTTSVRALGKADIFLAKLAPNLSVNAYATRLGGSNIDVGRACYVDGSGNAYVVAELGSPDLLTLNAFQLRIGGAVDGALFKFTPN